MPYFESKPAELISMTQLKTLNFRVNLKNAKPSNYLKLKY